MTSITFEHKVIVEQVRCIESSQALLDEAATVASGDALGQPFEVRLLKRAQRLVREHALSDNLSHAAGIFRISNLLAILLAAALGAVATLTALSGGSTINIYWLLLVLVGFNLLSIGLWLAGVIVGMEKLTHGFLSNATAWLPTLLSRRDSPAGQADSAWLACHFGGSVGKWRASQITQQLWLVYLGTGLACLLLILMARQFDFVWGTTLLADTAFINLTSALGEPLKAIGFATPSTQQVLETRIGAGFTLTGEHRYNWAQFLIGALLVCGVIPRLLLWLATTMLLNSARHKYALDLYLPYYVHLRQRLMPLHGTSQIVDKDTRAPRASEAVALAGTEGKPTSQLPTHLPNQLPDQLPNNAQWVAVELDDQTPWPPQGINTKNALGQVIDRASLEVILEALRAQGSHDLAIAVTAARTPDRGLKRSIGSLAEAATHSWLVLLLQRSQGSIAESRLSAWYRLAQECAIPAENVITHVEPST